MGDRGQIMFKMDNNKLYYYTHWNGSIMGHLLQEAIRFGIDRWDDKTYLLRIIVSRLTHCDVEATTGSGLGFETFITDDYLRDYEVDINKLTVKRGDWENPISFKDFIKLDLGSE